MSREGYSSHANFIERHNAVTAACDICEEKNKENWLPCVTHESSNLICNVKCTLLLRDHLVTKTFESRF